MRISDWSSDVCSSDLAADDRAAAARLARPCPAGRARDAAPGAGTVARASASRRGAVDRAALFGPWCGARRCAGGGGAVRRRKSRHLGRQSLRSEEQTSELQSIMRNSYAVVCLKKKKKNIRQTN